MYKIIYRFIYFVPWLFLSLAIIYVSNQNHIDFLKDGFMFEDKILHFFAYLIYGLTIQFAFINSKNINERKFFTIVILIGATFALTDEIHQYFVEGRSSDIFDWISDTLGIVTSLLFRNIVLWSKSIVDRYMQ